MLLFVVSTTFSRDPCCRSLTIGLRVSLRCGLIVTVSSLRLVKILNRLKLFQVLVLRSTVQIVPTGSCTSSPDHRSLLKEPLSVWGAVNGVYLSVPSAMQALSMRRSAINFRAIIFKAMTGKRDDQKRTLKVQAD